MHVPSTWEMINTYAANVSAAFDKISDPTNGPFAEYSLPTLCLPLVYYYVNCKMKRDVIAPVAFVTTW